jgi:glycosyltransferase involved in cell wall biosynthesis
VSVLICGEDVIGPDKAMDFVIIANSWGASLDNPTSKHQIALELAKQGHRVLWVEAAGMRRPRLTVPADRRRMAAKVWLALKGAQEVSRNIWRLSPLILPLPSSAFARAFNRKVYLVAMSFGVRRAGFERPVLVNFMPNLPDVMEAWHGPSVYYCVDRWDAFNMYDSMLMSRLDEQCCRVAGLVIASSKNLFDRCSRFSANTRLVTHGVDYAHFVQQAGKQVARPADLPAGNIIGFFGLLSEWIDQGLLVKLARAIPSSHVVLIGKADVAVDELRLVPNIHILGPRHFKDLPAYVAHFDVGIIPFVVNDLTRAINPIKLREMLASGCPVVSTDLPEVTALSRKTGREVEAFGSPYVTVAGTSDEFVRMVEERLKSPLTREQKRVVSDSMKTETWEEKVRQILELVKST